MGCLGNPGTVRESPHQDGNTVDGTNPANQLRLVVYPVYPIIYGDLYIPGGCLGFLPSTV